MRDLYGTFVHIMDSIDADVYVADMETYEIIFMNQHMRNSFGADWVGKICWKVFRNETQPCSICTNSKLLDTHGYPVGEVVWEGQNPITGRWYKNFDRAIAWGDGRYVRLEVATDITDIKEAQQRFYHQANHNSLTNLPNRKYFFEQLSQHVMLDGDKQRPFAVAFLDIDNFKSINDRFGHSLGDRVLIEASERMKSCLRENDLISRVSGDEFTFILTQLATKKYAAQVVERIIKSVSKPFLIQEKVIEITVSVGISFYPDDATDSNQLLQFSDEAMYRIKAAGKNGYGFYSEQVNENK